MLLTNAVFAFIAGEGCIYIILKHPSMKLLVQRETGNALTPATCRFLFRLELSQHSLTPAVCLQSTFRPEFSGLPRETEWQVSKRRKKNVLPATVLGGASNELCTHTHLLSRIEPQTFARVKPTCT